MKTISSDATYNTLTRLYDEAAKNLSIALLSDNVREVEEAKAQQKRCSKRLGEYLLIDGG